MSCKWYGRGKAQPCPYHTTCVLLAPYFDHCNMLLAYLVDSINIVETQFFAYTISLPVFINIMKKNLS